MSNDRPTALTVVGLVYFEVAVPEAVVAMGREVFVDRIEVSVGGALNTASIAHALGMPVVLAYPSGSGLTDRMASAMIEGLGFVSLTWDGRDDTAVSVVIDGPGDRAFVSSADFAALESCPELPVSSWIHVPGLREANILGHRLRAARARGARISVSACWATEELDALSRSTHEWDLLFLNEVEAKRAAGSIEEAPARLGGAAPNIIVTRGRDGAFGVVGGEAFSVPARRIDVKRATGAGDAFAAGFLSAYARGATPLRAAEVGTEVAARRLTAPKTRIFDGSRYHDLRVAG